MTIDINHLKRLVGWQKERLMKEYWEKRKECPSYQGEMPFFNHELSEYKVLKAFLDSDFGKLAESVKKESDRLKYKLYSTIECIKNTILEFDEEIKKLPEDKRLRHIQIKHLLAYLGGDFYGKSSEKFLEDLYDEVRRGNLSEELFNKREEEDKKKREEENRKIEKAFDQFMEG